VFASRLTGLSAGEGIDPSPQPSISNDPFAPDVTIWPEAPEWLFPSVMTALAVAVAVVVVLLVMWRRAVVYQRLQREQMPPTDWVDLSKLKRGGRWEGDQDPAISSEDNPQG
jgi:hypothetical protein